MSETKIIRNKIEMPSVAGPLWFGGWLFTIGYLHLSFWGGVLGLILWPYFLGAAMKH
jgi:hypothetical protein